MCLCGISCGVINDFVIKDHKEMDDSGVKGDIFAVFAAILYACENIVMEYLVVKDHDLFHFMGWVGLFGACIGFIEASIFGDFKHLQNVMKPDHVVENFTQSEKVVFLIWNILLYCFFGVIILYMIPK